MTSIEWLIQQLVELDKQLDGRRKNDDATIVKLNPTAIYEKAKAMHRQEILDAFEEGSSDGYDGWGSTNKEKYYNETFKKE